MRLVIIGRDLADRLGEVLVLCVYCWLGQERRFVIFSGIIVCFELSRMLLLRGSMDKSIVSLKHCVISLFFVPSAIDLVHQSALLMHRLTTQSTVFDTMALVVANPLRSLSPASMKTSYSVRNKFLRLFCNN